jgi:AraC family transcriptional activator FtrA
VVPPHRPGGQAQFIPAAVAHGAGHVLGDVLPWALERLDRPTTVRDLAREARMSPRTLARHFTAVTGMSPLRWLHTQRIRLAQELLETTSLTIEQIATRTGMGAATTLRRHFSGQLGVPPETYRRTFRGLTP